MEAFPANIRSPDGERATGLICPDCDGSISVSARDGGLLVFRCRVGHVYTVEEMVIGKENHIEQAMWTAIHAYAEMADFLRSLGERPRGTTIPAAEQARRAEQADANARAVRQVLEHDRRILLPEQLDGGKAVP